MPARLDSSRPHVLRDEAEYEAAIREIEQLLDDDPTRGSEALDRLEFRSVLVEDYEDRHYPVESVTPQQAVDFMLEQKSMTRADLDEIMGGGSSVSEFFTENRQLSRTQIEALRRRLGIPADVLLGLDEDRDRPPGDVRRAS